MGHFPHDKYSWTYSFGCWTSDCMLYSFPALSVPKSVQSVRSGCFGSFWPFSFFLCCLFLAGKTKMRNKQWSRGSMERQCLGVTGWCNSSWADRVVCMRNSRGLKVPPISPGGFTAQQYICGPQAHKTRSGVCDPLCSSYSGILR